MSDTYTSNVAFAMPAANQTGWNVEINANYQLADALAPVGGMAVTLTEQPSATLNVKVAPGQFVSQAGAVVTFAGAASQAITTATTKVLYLDGTAAWALTVGASYPTTAHVRLATVIAGVSTITSIVDNRQCFNVVGSELDGTVWVIGSASGLQIGSASTQKVGFLGATPAAQATGGAATASGSYTATEQGMLQKAYNALRTFGLLS